MFRHKDKPADEAEKKVESTATQPDVAVLDSKISGTETVKSEASLKELIEKNLKWSQIIYEQNRKINNKLLWSAIANWLRIFLIVIPLVLAVVFLGPMLKGVFSQYSELFGGNPSTTTTKQNSMESFFKLFNLDPAQQEQLKAFLK